MMSLFIKSVITGAVIYTSPIWGTIYMNMLGKTVNRKAKIESGYLYSIEPPEMLTNFEKYSAFENSLSYMEHSSWYMLMAPPLTIIPFGHVCGTVITYPLHLITVGTK